MAAKAVIIQTDKETATAVNPKQKPTPRPSRLTAKLDSLHVQTQLTLGLFLFSVGIGHFSRLVVVQMDNGFTLKLNTKTLSARLPETSQTSAAVTSVQQA
jgi:hypothetical protein